MTQLMAGKRGLIMGVANDHSIAWGIAKALHEEGAALAFSSDWPVSPIDPIAGIHALLDWAAEQGVGTAVVTNAPRRNALAMLAAAGLAARLPIVIIGDECVRAKPDPAPYQAGMAALGLDATGAEDDLLKF